MVLLVVKYALWFGGALAGIAILDKFFKFV